MLSTGLLIGAPGAIACADTDTDGGSHAGSSSSQAGEHSTGTSGAQGRHGSLSKSLQKAVRDATRAVDSVSGALGLPHASTGTRPGGIRSAPPTKTATPPADAGPGAAGSTTAPIGTAAATPADPSASTDPSAVPVASSGTTTEPTATAPAELPGAADPLSGSTLPAAVTHTVKPLSTGGGSGSSVVAPTTTPAIPNLWTPTASALVTSLTQIASSLGTAAVTVPGLLWSLPSSETPISDVIEFLQTTLTSVTGAVAPLMQLPGDLAGMLLGTNWAVPVSTLAQPNVGPFVPPMPTGPSLLLPGLPTAPTVSAPSGFFPAPDAVEFATRGGLAAAPLRSETTAFLPDTEAADTSSDGAAFIKGAVTALLVSVSLWALFTAALPGLSGLAAISATGVRIGYRQANAGAALRSTGLARFAAGGPIGVVRSGSMVAVHVPKHAAAAAARPVQLRIVDRAA